MFQVITALVMGWFMMFVFLQLKPLKAEVHVDGVYVHVIDVAIMTGLVGVFTLGSWVFLECIKKGFSNV